MIVTIGRKKLAEILMDERLCTASFGPKMTRVIFRRLNQLHAASSLEILRNGVGRCHELKADLEGCFALDLIHPQRLVFKPDPEDKDCMDGRTIIWNKVISVEVIKIDDYH